MQTLLPPTLLSTTVEIILYYLTILTIISKRFIYNSRNYSILLNKNFSYCSVNIYNSRNYSILLNLTICETLNTIYNSRNYSILLNINADSRHNIIYNSRNYSILLNSKFVYLHNFFGAKQLYFYYFI